MIIVDGDSLLQNDVLKKKLFIPSNSMLLSWLSDSYHPEPDALLSTCK